VPADHRVAPQMPIQTQGIGPAARAAGWHPTDIRGPWAVRQMLIRPRELKNRPFFAAAQAVPDPPADSRRERRGNSGAARASSHGRERTLPSAVCATDRPTCAVDRGSANRASASPLTLFSTQSLGRDGALPKEGNSRSVSSSINPFLYIVSSFTFSRTLSALRNSPLRGRQRRAERRRKSSASSGISALPGRPSKSKIIW